MAAARPPDSLTVAETAEALGVSVQRVYQLINWGRLSATKVGARYYVPIAEVDARIAGDQRLASNQCITSSEVAAFFGVDVRTVRDWYAAGELRGSKINNQLCFAPQDVITFIPKTFGGPGRHPARKATRTLRGRVYPLPPNAPPTMKGPRS